MQQLVITEMLSMDLQSELDCPSPKGKFWYLGILKVSTWEKEPSSSASSRPAQGSEL